MAEAALGRVEDGGLGWPPSEFWNATVYDLDRAMALARRRAGAITKEEAKQLEMHLRDEKLREAEARAAAGDHRSHDEVIREIMKSLETQGSA